jgi:hypothetical protein
MRRASNRARREAECTGARRRTLTVAAGGPIATWSELTACGVYTGDPGNRYACVSPDSVELSDAPQCARVPLLGTPPRWTGPAPVGISALLECTTETAPLVVMEDETRRLKAVFRCDPQRVTVREHATSNALHNGVDALTSAVPNYTSSATRPRRPWCRVQARRSPA